MFSWANLKKPFFTLAPMAGYTDSPFRQLVKEICPPVICFTEFTSTDGIMHGNQASRRHVFFNTERERPLIAQIFGKKPEKFAESAKLLTDLKVDAIDINMGCPAKKVVSADHGSAILKDPVLATEIVQATVESTALPVSVKMRIGISKYDEDYFFKFAKNLEKAGAKLISVHGRTAKQMYSGTADWTPIYELKKVLNIPVIGNGDIWNGEDAVNKLGNLDGIMVGRASIGNPWIFCEVVSAFENKRYKRLNFQEKIPYIKKHIELSCEFKGEEYGILEMRKHLVGYVKGLPNASVLRQKLVKGTKKEEIFSILDGYASFT